MFHFLRKSRIVPRNGEGRQLARGPITIGFEQLEVREMLSPGLALTIIPTDTRPLLSMPRPYVANFDPEAERAVTVSLTPRREPEENDRLAGLWPFGGRFRFRF
jgi:hypothetical protein